MNREPDPDARGLPADGEVRLGDWSWRVPAEQQRVIARCWARAGPRAPFPRGALDGTITERFASIARAQPDAPAVVDEGADVLTYGELALGSSRIACAVGERIGRRAQPVPVLVDSRRSAIVAMLGVLESGMVMVPLDAGLPAQRLRRILEDVGAPLILADAARVELARRAGGAGVRVVDIAEIGTAGRESPPPAPLGGNSPALLVYTSGSTGRPKGVIECHRGLLHCVRNLSNALAVGPADRLALLHSHCVVGGIRNILTALLNGAAIHPYRVDRDGVSALGDWLGAREITLYDSVPTVFRHFVRHLRPGNTLPCLRVVRIGGEPVHAHDVELFQQHLGRDGAVFATTFGATEMNRVCLYVVGAKSEVPRRLPAGYPLDGLEVALLDAAGSPVTPGSPGRIAVRSRYVALGYWRDDALTASRFARVDDGSGNRQFTSGDLGRLASDGCLHHLGRDDDQLKVRGNRIHASEVEGVLLGQPSVREAIVAIRPDLAGGSRLVAYVVPEPGPGLSVSALRRAIAQELPAYMVPGVFVEMAAFDRTAGGKLDRSALPEPPRRRPDLETAYGAPRDPHEAALARIWAEVLELDRIGIDDGFLELGGDSLRAGEVAARVAETFGVKLPLVRFFSASTVAGMAELLADARTDNPAATAELLAVLQTLPPAEALRLLGGDRGSDAGSVPGGDLRPVTPSR